MAIKKLRVSEYARIMQCDASTVYRQIQQGKLESEKVDDVLHVVVDEDELQGDASSSQEPKVELLLEENKWLKERIEHLETELSEKDKRHDTIVLTITQQLEKKELMLEDMKKKEAERKDSFWSRLFNFKKWSKQTADSHSQ